MAKKTNDKMVKTETDGLTKDQRRIRNLKLKADAKQRAFNEKLNWFDDIPAAQFHANFDNAFNIATTHAKAVELLVDPSAPIATPVVVEQPKTIAEKADEAVERFEERQKTSAQLTAEAAKATLTGNVANDNTETANEDGTTGAANVEADATAEAATVEATTADNAVSTDTTSANDTPPVDTVEEPTEQATPELVNEFDEKGKLIRWPNESSKSYGRRAHKAKLAKAWVKPTEATVEETRNGEPPIATVDEKSYPTGKLDYHSDHDGQSVQPKKALPGLPTGKTPSEINKALPLDTPVELPEAKIDPMLKQPNESKKAWKARIALLQDTKAAIETPQSLAAPEKSALESANVFEAAEMGEQTTATAVPDATETGTEEAPTTEAPVVDTPAEEAPNNQPEEVQEPVQTEPVNTPVEPGPSEAKTDKTPSNVISINNIPMGIEAKKFYGAAFTNERAKLLAEAYRWLSKAVDAEANGNTTTLATMMKAALRKEADAFAIGTTVAMAA